MGVKIEPGVEEADRTVPTAAGSGALATVPDQALLVILRREAMRHGLPAPMRIREHLPWEYHGTATAELLECVLASGAEWRVLWKRGLAGPRDPHDPRGGVTYETQLYEHILGPGGYGPPKFLGATHDPTTGEDWLFEEFLPGAIRLTEFPVDIARSAAGWLGQFHRAFERSPVAPASAFVRRYDTDWYIGWVEAAMAVIGQAGRQTPEIEAVANGLRYHLPRMLEGPRTLIHGEFYPRNILVDRVAIRPVDWESAAMAAGEVDLATLTEGWAADVETVLVDRYRAARWLSKPPPGFEERYQAARAYSACRRLGDRTEWSPEADRYLEQLLDAATRLGLADAAPGSF